MSGFTEVNMRGCVFDYADLGNTEMGMADLSYSTFLEPMPVSYLCIVYICSDCRLQVLHLPPRRPLQGGGLWLPVRPGFRRSLGPNGNGGTAFSGGAWPPRSMGSCATEV